MAFIIAFPKGLKNKGASGRCHGAAEMQADIDMIKSGQGEIKASVDSYLQLGEMESSAI